MIPATFITTFALVKPIYVLNNAIMAGALLFHLLLPYDIKLTKPQTVLCETELISNLQSTEDTRASDTCML